MNFLKSYRGCFKNLDNWAFATAAGQFIVFMFAFLLLCFSYTLMEIQDDSHTKHEIFISKFEKYLTLTSAILLLFPFLASLLLTFSLLHEYDKLSDLWVKLSLGFTPTYILGLIGSGIYLAVEGSYVGYIAIVLSLLIGAFMGHSILIIYFLNQDPMEDIKLDDNSSIG